MARWSRRCRPIACGTKGRGANTGNAERANCMQSTTAAHQNHVPLPTRSTQTPLVLPLLTFVVSLVRVVPTYSSTIRRMLALSFSFTSSAAWDRNVTLMNRQFLNIPFISTSSIALAGGISTPASHYALQSSLRLFPLETKLDGSLTVGM